MIVISFKQKKRLGDIDTVFLGVKFRKRFPMSAHARNQTNGRKAIKYGPAK